MCLFIGSRIGGRKLAPLISPNKTISGALGGIFIPTLVCVIIFYDKDLLLNIIFFRYFSLALSKVVIC